MVKRINSTILLKVLNFLNTRYGSGIYVANCRISKRFCELLYLTPKCKVVEVRLVTDVADIGRMLDVQKGENSPDYLYLILQEDLYVPPFSSSIGVGLLYLEADTLEFRRKATLKKGKMPLSLVIKRCGEGQLAALLGGRIC